MSARKKPPAPPGHLSASAAEWWRHVMATYELEQHDMLKLQACCEAWDRKEDARRQIGTDGATYVDRFGAPRVHPSVAIERDARLAFARLLRELDLEGEPHPGYRRK